jgi:hypothetical protein
MNARRAALADVLLLTALVVPRALHAKEASCVTVVSSPNAAPPVEEAAVRLSAELRAAGFAVRLVEGTPGSDGRARVEGATGASGRCPGDPFATIAIMTTGHGAAAEIWVADHVTKKTLVRRIEGGDDANATNAASDLAVRTVELLQASLLEVRVAPKGSVPPDVRAWIEKPKPPPPPPPRRTHIASIEAGFGFRAGGTLGVAPVPLLRLGVELPANFAIRGFAAATFTTTTLETNIGSVALQERLAALDLAYAFRSARARVYPTLSLGGGLYDLGFDGRPASSGGGHRGNFFAAMLVAGAALRLRILPNLTAFADFQVIVVQREAVITVLGAPIGHSGRPLFLPSAGLVAHF